MPVNGRERGAGGAEPDRPESGWPDPPAGALGTVLAGIRVVVLAVNVPGPQTARRLCDLGARVVKVEPPAGDPLSRYAPAYFAQLNAGIEIAELDLKDAAGRAAFQAHLGEADVFLSSLRPSALTRLGLAWPTLHERYPDLVHVSIVGESAPRDEHAGHDLTYVASLGLTDPPRLPLTLIADLAGAEAAVSATLALLLRRANGRGAAHAAVALRDAAAAFAAPLTFGLTRRGGLLGGGFAGYGLYRARDGWIALAALEAHFWLRLCDALGIPDDSAPPVLATIFEQRSVAEWEGFARAADIPLTGVAAV